MMSEDPDLLAELGELLRRCDPMPDEVRAAAEVLFSLAFLPREWTYLRPLAAPAMTRSGVRVFRFGDKETAVELEVRGAHLTGVVSPVMDVEVCWPSGSRLVRPDDAGLFRLDGLPRGPLRVVVGRTRASQWFWP